MNKKVSRVVGRLGVASFLESHVFQLNRQL